MGQLGTTQEKGSESGFASFENNVFPSAKTKSLPKSNAFDSSVHDNNKAAGPYTNSSMTIPMNSQGPMSNVDSVRATPFSGPSHASRSTTTQPMGQSFFPSTSMPTTMSMATVPTMTQNRDSMSMNDFGQTSAPLGAFGASTPFVRPSYVDLEANRVHPAGPVKHPNPSFRPTGINNWTEILYDYTLLQYLSNANIKEIKDHMNSLGSAVDPTNPAAAVLIDQGPYNTDDAKAVWKYCDAYMKRRGQERNNKAARRSRARKEAETLHWKRIAVEAGAPDQDFTYDGTDPAYNDDGDAEDGVLPRETAEAIAAMKETWASEWAAAGSEAPSPHADIPGQLPLPSLPPHTVVASQSAATPGQTTGHTHGHLQEVAPIQPAPIAPQSLEQIYQLVYGTPDPFQGMPKPYPQPTGEVPLPALTHAQTHPANARSSASIGPESTSSATFTASVPSTSSAPSLDQAQYEDASKGGAMQDNINWNAFPDNHSHL